MNVLEHLNNYIDSGIKEKRLLVRFRMDDILKGSTDFSVIEYGIKTGWKVFIRFDLHAKTYIVDNKRGVIGSANATNSGLSIGKSGNMEMATLVNIEPKDVEKVDKLFYDAIRVNQDILDNLKMQINSAQHYVENKNNSWDLSIISLFHPHITTLFSYEIPDTLTLKEGEYISFLDEVYDGDINKLKKSFRWSNVYLWLLDTLEDNCGCLYFGKLSEKLHDTLVSDPKPYRRDVKQMLANLLNFIQELEMEEVIIDRPNYSQRIRLVDVL